MVKHVSGKSALRAAHYASISILLTYILYFISNCFFIIFFVSFLFYMKLFHFWCAPICLSNFSWMQVAAIGTIHHTEIQFVFSNLDREIEKISNTFRTTCSICLMWMKDDAFIGKWIHFQMVFKCERSIIWYGQWAMIERTRYFLDIKSRQTIDDWPIKESIV